METKLDQWYMGNEEALINIFDNYDRSRSCVRYPAPGTCDTNTAWYKIQHYVDMCFDGTGFARSISLDGKIVGHIQYTNRIDIYESNCDIEIILLPEASGKGIGTWALKKMIEHAFYEKDYECVFATVSDTNVAACRMCLKAGMKYLGVENPEHKDEYGVVHNMIVYGIRRPKKELTNTGVEIKKWEYRDINSLAHLYDSVDKRYDDLENPLIQDGYFSLTEEDLQALDSIERFRRLAFQMREYMGGWNVWENHGGDIYRAIVNNGEVVGLISVRMQQGKRSLDGLLGYMLMPEHCGKGIATKALPLMLQEAFSLRDLHRVTALVYKPNIASIRVLEKNGFRLEGVLEDGVMCEGKPTDYLIYGLLRKNFADPKSTKENSDQELSH